MGVFIRKYTPPVKWISSGGVVFAAPIGEYRKHVYLVKPANKIAPWGLPKGRVDAGETLVQAAVREVREESGIVAALLPGYLGKHEGSFSVTHYFPMVFRYVGGAFCWETEDVRIMHIDRAIRLAVACKNTRDAKVLTLAKQFMKF